MWDAFNDKLQDTPKLSSTQEPIGFQTPPGQIVVVTTEGPKTSFQDREVIPADPTTEIVLNVIDIPRLDAFYSPLHKSVVKRQRKRRRIETPSEHEFMDVLWKDTQSKPIENLTRLSQFVGAYATTIGYGSTENKS